MYKNILYKVKHKPILMMYSNVFKIKYKTTKNLCRVNETNTFVYGNLPIITNILGIPDVAFGNKQAGNYVYIRNTTYCNMIVDRIHVIQ